MPKGCSISHHPQIREITHDLMSHRPLRAIEARYGVSKAALSRHTKKHVPKALRKVTPDDMPPSLAAELAEPVLVEMRKLNNRSLKILKAAEESKDYTMALHAIRETRRNLELIAKLNGELHSSAPGEEAGGGLQVVIQYVDKAIQVGESPKLLNGADPVAPLNQTLDRRGEMISDMPADRSFIHVEARTDGGIGRAIDEQRSDFGRVRARTDAARSSHWSRYCVAKLL